MHSNKYAIILEILKISPFESFDSLEISKILRNDPKVNHTSSDGQKYSLKSSINSTNAGYSYKYLGADKGVSVDTFIDESHKLFYSIVINVNERESGYVIDGLMHNEVVKSDIHSTDTLLFIFQNMDTNKTSFLQAS